MTPAVSIPTRATSPNLLAVEVPGVRPQAGVGEDFTSSAPAFDRGRHGATDVARMPNGGGYEVTGDTTSFNVISTLPQGCMAAAGIDGGRVAIKALASVQSGWKAPSNFITHSRSHVPQAQGCAEAPAVSPETHAGETAGVAAGGENG